MSIQSTAWLTNASFFTKSKPTSAYFKTESEAYERPTDFLVEVNHTLLCMADTPVCAVGAGTRQRRHSRRAGGGGLLFLWAPRAKTRIFLNGGFTETIIYTVCIRNLIQF